MSVEKNIACKLSLTKNDFTLSLEAVFSSTGVTAVFGRSGSGKTTLLRCLAGLECAAGQVAVNQTTWQDSNTFLPPHQRPVGYVFQSANLFYHLSVQKNLVYAQRYGSQRRTENVEVLGYDEVVDLCGVRHLLARCCDGLSGGERQRVAIARALLTQPEVLLMDEPLASLDDSGKHDILGFLLKIKQRVDLPIIFVSHSVNEVARIADEVLVLEAGRVVRQGSVSEVFNPSVLLSYEEEPGFIVAATVVEKDEQWGLVHAAFSGGIIYVRDTGMDIGQRIKIYILAKDVSITLSEHCDSSVLNILPSRIVSISDIEKNMQSVLVSLQIGDTSFLAKITRRSLALLELACDQMVYVQIKTMAIL